ncbi:MAG: DCC1-like thiol-disulfide oxidoreductase family protein [Pirellulales bacterium]
MEPLTDPAALSPSRWTRFAHEPLRAERIAVARIFFAFVLLGDQIVQMLPFLDWCYGPNGFAPAGLYDGNWAETWRWAGTLLGTDNMAVITTCFWLWVAATFAFLVGYFTRAAGVLVWLGAMCFLARNPMLKNGGDDILQIALLLLMFAPCGRALSIDAWRRRRKLAAAGDGEALRASRFVPPWAVRVFQLELCTIYFFTGLAKLGGETWWQGTSVHYVLNDITISRWSFAQFPVPIWITAPVNYISLAFEVFFPLLVLWRRTRFWTLLYGILFHVGIFLSVDVGWFSIYTIALYGVWIPDAWWWRYFGPGRGHDGPIDEPENMEAGPHDYRVYFDTLCPICRRSRAALQRLDWGGRLVFRDIHDRERMEREVPGVSYSRALREIIVATPEQGSGVWGRGLRIAAFGRLRRLLFGPKVLGGFAALRRVAWALPAVWPVLPVLYVPLVPTVARCVYRAVARNRYRLATCEDGTCELHLRALAKANLDEAEIRRIVAQARGSRAAAGEAGAGKAGLGQRNG